MSRTYRRLKSHDKHWNDYILRDDYEIEKDYYWAKNKYYTDKYRFKPYNKNMRKMTKRIRNNHEKKLIKEYLTTYKEDYLLLESPLNIENYLKGIWYRYFDPL